MKFDGYHHLTVTIHISFAWKLPLSLTLKYFITRSTLSPSETRLGTHIFLSNSSPESFVFSSASRPLKSMCPMYMTMTNKGG
ncbi:hypothetical protein MARPO_0170s0001 [Marchantia polymorpha]|uniref:Uncharacterized protein n=1 Tax=Marchantia polymorpha TaxID=3197 RepID=A0A2R6W2X2_MARPO|nr:hypothetical protein MARPO_0170s0001 [Marchantia polymorpha]PTQ28193.1 hypothetical protein MARPO_0170s0001 [Marchantia polymorpha]|eukprot:PTQ28192.1 hypothetical protein MARPO_0170s0001 [Marchantia polymorpha]